MKGERDMPFAVIDVETTMIKDGEYPRTRFWGYADEKGYLRFETTQSFLAFLKSSPPHTLLHHSNFDVLQLLLDGANLQILRSHNSRLIRCKIGNHILLNSYSVFPLALGKIFECFGYEKTQLSCKRHSLDDGEDNEEKETAQLTCKTCNQLLAKRNYEDCVNALICFHKMDEIFVRLVAVSPLEKGTIAGTSFTAAKICAGSKMPKDERFLESYRGGRVEVFNTSTSACDKFDINSSYPFSFFDCPTKARLLRVRVKTTDFYAPLFDAQEVDTFLFPNGQFESWVYQDNWERYIEPHSPNTKIKILERETIDLSWLISIRPLIETLYRLKNESKIKGDKAMETVCKLLLNSLYGRIGLKGESERARILDYRPDTGDGTLFKLGRKRWLVFDTVFRETQSNFPFAAYITCNARARLFRAFTGSKAFYGDTDSVFSPNGADYFKRHEREGDSLGAWKAEGRNTFRALNVKDYLFGSEEVRKGGAGFTQWTLKTLASGNEPRMIERNRISELRKRLATSSGVTLPLQKDYTPS